MSRGTVRGITTLPRANMEPRSVDGRRQVALSLICTISLICQSFRPLGLGRGLLEALRKLLASAPCMLSHDLSWCTPPQTDGNTTWGPDPALTLLGQEQALNVAAEWALEIPNGARLPDVIWSSPLRRAAHTLALTYEKTAIAQGVRPMFKEVSLRLMSHRSLASPEEQSFHPLAFINRDSENASVCIHATRASPVRVLSLALSVLRFLQSNVSTHICVLRAAYFLATTFARLQNPSNPLNFDFEPGFRVNDELWRPNERETAEHQQARTTKILDELFATEDAIDCACSSGCLV